MTEILINKEARLDELDQSPDPSSVGRAFSFLSITTPTGGPFIFSVRIAFQ